MENGEIEKPKKDLPPFESVEIKKIKCFECEEEIKEVLSYVTNTSNKICVGCREDMYFYCEDCSELELNDNAYNLDHGSVCSVCYNDNYFTCERCDTVRCNDDGCSCDSDDEEEGYIPTRDYDRTDKYTVQNQRAYACEIECYYPKMSVMKEVADEIPYEIGIVEDGSLDDNGVEFNTPKLSGVRGERMLEKFCTTLKENKFWTNSSCGLHIHLDGKDILSTKNAIQKMMIFFMIYEDVIMSFLPESRRDNTYCLPISEFYHLREIKDCYTVEDFEKIWYRQEDKQERDQYKRDRHHQTRYAGINFHSLLAGGHLEIRYHSGTINFEKIINWIKLFVLIMDSIHDSCKQSDYKLGNKLSLPALLKAKFILGLPEKTLSFFNMIDLPKEQQAYFIARQKKFIGGTPEETTTKCAE